MKLDPWQVQALECQTDLLLCTGRQVGKTTLLSVKAGKFLIEKPKSTIICCSLTEDQAKLIIIMTLGFLEKHYKKHICKGAKKPTQNKIELINGSKIIARPVGQTGDAVRGFTGDILILDEVARFSELIMESAKPTLLTTGGKIWAASTPHGKRGWFWETYQNRNKRFTIIEANAWDIIHNRELSEKWSQKVRDESILFLEQERKDMTEAQFGQEYMGLFMEQLSSYFPSELIRKCMLPGIQHPLPGDYYSGIDIARLGKDVSVIASFAKIGDKLKMFDMEILRKTLTTETFRRILQADRKHRYKRIYIDSGGVGAGVYDMLLQEPQTSSRIIPIDNASRALDRGEKPKTRKLFKEDLYSNLKTLMERGHITFLDSEEIFYSLSCIQYEVLESGITKIHGDKDHICEAITRAAWCMAEKHLNLWVHYR